MTAPGEEDGGRVVDEGLLQGRNRGSVVGFGSREANAIVRRVDARAAEPALVSGAAGVPELIWPEQRRRADRLGQGRFVLVLSLGFVNLIVRGRDDHEVDADCRELPFE